MAKAAPAPPPCRLYLATPAIADPAAMAAALQEAIAAHDVAAVLVRLADADARSLTTRVKALAGPIQAAGAALLIEGRAELVARGGADGAHLVGLAALQEAMAGLKPQRIAGVGGLATRHDAMTAGEAGADYVLFGEPDAGGHRPALDAIAERIDWWAELFEPPCVGYAATPEEAAALSRAGADFVLVAPELWTGRGNALAETAQAIRQARPAATAVVAG